MVWNSHTAAGVAFIVTGLLFTVLAGRNIPASKRFDLDKLKPFRGAILALEFVDTPRRAADIFTQMPREKIEKQTRGDSYVFIPVYVLVFSAAIFLIFRWAQTGVPAPLRVAATVLGVCLVLAAAAFDYRENNATFALLDATEGKSDSAVALMPELQPVLDRIRGAALVKWGLLFGVLAVMSVPLFAHGGGGWAVGGLFLLAGALGLFSLVPPARALVEWAFVLMGLSLTTLGLWFASL
jgi:hypothetical protein